MNILQIVNQYETLSSDPENREGMNSEIPILLQFYTKNPNDPEIVRSCLQTIFYLSESPRNKIDLAKSRELVGFLKKNMIAAKVDAHRDLSIKIYSNIQRYVAQHRPHPRGKRPLDDTNACENKENKENDSINRKYLESVPSEKPTSFNVYIRNLSARKMKEVDTLLLSTKGIVSFTQGETTNGKILLRYKGKKDSIIELLNEHGFESSLTPLKEPSFSGPQYLDPLEDQKSTWGWGQLVSFGSKSKSDNPSKKQKTSRWGLW